MNRHNEALAMIQDAEALDRSWRASAACRGMNTAAFFPERGISPQETAALKAVCGGCPVRAECLEYALVAGLTHGLWGGLSERQRRRIRGARRRGAAA